VAVVSSGALALRFISYGYISYAWGMVMIQAFNGAGDTTTPTIINLFCFWLLELPLAYSLSLPLGVEERGVYIAIVTSETVMGVVAMIVFRRGRWKTREL
jgi:Na+-driven multidrug efflux pump